jgi:hypothetical protein
VTKTFETGPHKVKIDLFDVSSETTITVITDESPAGNNTAILKKDVSGSHNSAHFRNAGAYESFTIRVEGADGPVSMSKGGVTNAWKPGDDGKFLGDTGGDPGFTYDLSEQIGESVMPSVVQLDRTPIPGSTTVDTTETDAQQTKIDIYQSAQNSKAQATNYHTTLDNYLSDTKTQARIIGKNAYIRALNNGSSKATAKSQAKRAVSQYYAVKQANLLQEWNTQTNHIQYLRDTASSESGIDAKYVEQPTEDFDGTVNDYVYMEATSWNQRTSTVTLVNGSTADSNEIKHHLDFDGGGEDNKFYTDITTGDIDHVTYTNPNSGEGYYIDLRRTVVHAPDSNYDQMTALDYSEYASRWTTIQEQNTQVQNDIDTLAENTYSAY